MLLTRQHAISSLFLFSRKIFTYTLNKNVNEPSNKPFGNVVTIREGSWEEHTGQKVVTLLFYQIEPYKKGPF